MDIEEVKKDKKELEDKIFKLLTDFHTKTKMLPISVHLDILTVENMGNDYHQLLNNIRIDTTV